MSQISDIKNAIKGHLDTLKTAGTLGQVIMDDFKTEPARKDIASYPAAILGAPSIESGYETNRENMRTFSFEILVIQKGENVSSATAVEDLMETLLNAFDNDPTLGGKANGAVEPAATTPEPVATSDGTFIIFTISIKARAVVSLTF